ncbi:hypothetical protein GCM10023349_04460 [Nocardioides conyzicola]|uniref:Uncharacterized protein n=1 Tax=Nocardioides conyzicola TaxID=1651781 RepID=A0ABP8WQS4_9ACTN
MTFAGLEGNVAVTVVVPSAVSLAAGATRPVVRTAAATVAATATLEAQPVSRPRVDLERLLVMGRALRIGHEPVRTPARCGGSDAASH